MVEIKSISKSFQEDFWKKPNIVLNGVNFVIQEGKITGFVGKNGSGKTTTIKVLLGLIKPEGGQVNFNQKMGKDSIEIRHNIGCLPENPKFFENLTGAKFIKYMGRLHGIEEAEINTRLDRLSESLDLKWALDKKIGGYSKGMRQKIGFISAILHQPKLIILDEPLSGLDPESRRLFKEMILEQKNHGATVFLSSHILEDLIEICDNIVAMKAGKAVPVNSINENRALWITLKNSKSTLDSLDSRYVISQEISDSKVKLMIKESDRIGFLGDNSINSLDIIAMERGSLELGDLI